MRGTSTGNIKILFLLANRNHIASCNPLGLLKRRTSLLENQRKECWSFFFYSISKQETKVYIFLSLRGWGGVGGGRRRRGQRQSFEGQKKQIGINREHRKTSGEEGGQANFFQGN